MLLIGAKIQEYRKKAGLSQEEFADKIGVTRQAVSKWETDKAYPDLDKLVAICDIFQVSIEELIYGKIVSSLEEKPAGQALEMRGMSARKARRKGVYIRLWVLFALTGALFLFCGVIFLTTLIHYPRKTDDALIERIRVERVYQQYTKADLSFFDDVSRRVVKTVWLDVNGIREGDFLLAYTDEEQLGLYYEYNGRTLIVLGAVVIFFLILFLICIAELRRLVKENGWHILIDEVKENVQP
ncbi:MAG: helix-turn-helix domain-containing protein [Acetatifactor sp.]|nr:helix-turn-helix domain-containing protein [Acetatifactor sp.]